MNSSLAVSIAAALGALGNNLIFEYVGVAEGRR